MRCWSSHPVAGACGNGSLIHRLGRSPIGTEPGGRGSGIDWPRIGVVLLADLDHVDGPGESRLVGVRRVATDDEHPPRGVEPALGVVVHALASRCQLARRHGPPPSSTLASVAVAWCAISDCPNPGEFWAQIKWTGALGTETKGLLRPLAFCRDHSQSLRDGLPEGAIWLDKPPESE